MAEVSPLWFAESVSRLREHVQAGLSGTWIAAALHGEFGWRYTRNAVLGKLFRMGVKKPVKEPEPKKPRPKRAKRWVPPPKPEMEAVEATDLPADRSPYAVSLIDVREDQCRWPLNDAGPDFRFCGAPQMPPKVNGRRSSFCPRHDALAYRPYQPMTTRRPKLASRPYRPNGGAT